MTREEAISRLEQGAPFSEVSDKSWEEALDMAISVLKKLEEIENIIGYASLYMNDTEKYNKIKKVVERDD